jgi:dihydrofolate synthase/folylpolyglutamate synthase
VDQERFAAACCQVHEAAERLLASGDLDCHPTYFETVTAMAFLTFRDLHVDFAVLEVGLGGRLDATNVVKPDLAVITPIDFDHEAFLGKSLEAIAAEKAGILKPDSMALFAPQRPEVMPVLEAQPRRREFRRDGGGYYDAELCPGRFKTAGRGLLNIECPLAGDTDHGQLPRRAPLLGVRLPLNSGSEGRWPRLERCPAADLFLTAT